MAKALATALVYVVVQEFRDKDNFDKKYEEGQEVSFDEKRLATLLGLGLIEQKQADNTGTATNTAGNTAGNTGKQSSKKAGEGKAEDTKPAANVETTPADNTGEGGEGNGTGGSNPLLD